MQLAIYKSRVNFKIAVSFLNNSTALPILKSAEATLWYTHEDREITQDASLKILAGILLLYIKYWT